jgi:pSer/pThr/pTyr-binding forkhead associated (FHA) protein
VTVASIAIEEVLLLLKIGFLVLLYLFIWRVVRAASRDLRASQESFILAPNRAPEIVAPAARAGRLVVVSSPALKTGQVTELDSAPVTVGRSARNDLAIDRDEYASARHARFEPRADGVWVVDAGSTNGTFLNGVPLEGPRRLEPGDVVRVGSTDLRFDRA